MSAASALRRRRGRAGRRCRRSRGFTTRGLRSGSATFETRLRDRDDVRAWFGALPGRGRRGGRAGRRVRGTSEYRPRECYAGIAEFSVYVDARAPRPRRRAGGDGDAVRGGARAGFWKLVSRVFVENLPAGRCCARSGFREVGIYERHARLEGEWKDVSSWRSC